MRQIHKYKDKYTQQKYKDKYNIYPIQLRLLSQTHMLSQDDKINAQIQRQIYTQKDKDKYNIYSKQLCVL